jgi:phage replication O-like protein O
LLEALIRTSLSGQELKIALLVIRKTYGFNKKVDFISLTQMAKALACSKIRCAQVVKNLESMKILTVNENINGVGKSYRFNKDYSQWNTVNKNINRIEKTKQTVNENINHNINNTKEIYCPTSNEVRLSEKLLSLIRQRNANFKKPNIQKWASHVDRMLRLDKRPVEEIEKVITWCQADSFWHAHILSTLNLRDKYDKLYLKAFSGNGKLTNQRYY